MSLTVAQMDRQCKIADPLSLPQWATILPPSVIQEVLSDGQAWEQREKKLNMQAMIYLIIALALSPKCSTREVYRRLQEGLPEALIEQEQGPTAGAFWKLCQQLGVRPLRSLFTRVARPLARPETRSAFRFGLPLVATDGTMENLPETDATRTVFPIIGKRNSHAAPFRKRAV